MAGRTDEEVLESLDGDFSGALGRKESAPGCSSPIGTKGSRQHGAVGRTRGRSGRGPAICQGHPIGFDPAADPALNVTVAKLVVGWEAAKQRLQVKSQQGAHATVEREAKMIFLGCASGLSNSTTL